VRVIARATGTWCGSRHVMSSSNQPLILAIDQEPPVHALILFSAKLEILAIQQKELTLHYRVRVGSSKILRIFGATRSILVARSFVTYLMGRNPLLPLV